jgi:poly(3-hydroxybutyrate) depolymerase
MLTETVAQEEAEVNLLMAGKDTEWTEDVVDELRRIQTSSSGGERLQMHEVDKAGHWVHVNDMEGLL